MVEPFVPEQPVPHRRRLRVRVLRLVSLGLVASLLALLVWRLVDEGAGGRLVGKIRTGKAPPAPRFALRVIWAHAETWPPGLRRALADGKVSPAELRGYPVVINFWASWCGPCKDEAPRFVASARQHAGSVVFLGVVVQDFTSSARAFLRRYDTNYVSVKDGNGKTFTSYGLTGVPETYFLDGRGRLADHVAGELRRDDLERRIARLERGRSS